MRLDEIFDVDHKLTSDELDMFEDHMKATYDLSHFVLTLNYYGNIILNNIVVGHKKQGTGTAVMNELCKFADDHNVRIYLSPDRTNRDTGTTSRSRLILFYKRFGFVENKGRNKDFRSMDSMFRRPHASR